MKEMYKYHYNQYLQKFSIHNKRAAYFRHCIQLCHLDYEQILLQMVPAHLEMIFWLVRQSPKLSYSTPGVSNLGPAQPLDPAYRWVGLRWQGALFTPARTSCPRASPMLQCGQVVGEAAAMTARSYCWTASAPEKHCQPLPNPVLACFKYCAWFLYLVTLFECFIHHWVGR